MRSISFSIIILMFFISCSSQNIPRAKKLNPTNGNVLIVPSAIPSEKLEKPLKIKLIDKNGSTKRSWEVNYPVLNARLDKQNNIYILMDKSGQQSELSSGIFNTLEKRDVNNKLIWSHTDKFLHHDFYIKDNGNVLLLKYYPGQKSLFKEVKILGKSLYKGMLWFDRVQEIDPKTNKVVWEWKSHKHFPFDKILTTHHGDVLHTNSIDFTKRFVLTKKPAIMLSSRHLSKVFVIDIESKKVVWISPEKLFNHQHDATFLKNGNILVFNNAINNSQVIEYSLKKNKKVWMFNGGDNIFAYSTFYSAYVSGAQRLENGNTLVTVGTRSLVLEVSPDKKVLWNYFLYDQQNAMNTAWPFRTIFKARQY